MSCSQSFRNGGWDVNVYSSSAEYFEEDKGSEATCARLREAAKRMQDKIQEQEGELRLERDRVCGRDACIAELEAECAKLRKQVHRRNCRLTEQEHEIGGLQDEVQNGQDAKLRQAQRELVQLRRAARTRGKSMRTYMTSQDANLAELQFHNASLHRVLDADPEYSDSDSADKGTEEADGRDEDTEVADDRDDGTVEAGDRDDGTVEAGDRDDGTVEVSDRDVGTEAKVSWTETEAEAEQAGRRRRVAEVAAEEDDAYRRHHMEDY
ncbi:hypothetical protein B484DRAFT_405205 [Ochromonadaceae sp. CCMP2298]|nr:hypothetical protein B484DRAFT_405205 [Ochromonadaceae sp. CCMP2298]